MIFTETKLRGAYIIEPERIEDERGFFARSYCRREFEARGLNPNLVQCNISFNARKGTLRGMHYQLPPFAETKVIRCTKGAIYDVIIDLRSKSATFREWLAVNLTTSNCLMLYVPEGFAHGFQTLEDEGKKFDKNKLAATMLEYRPTDSDNNLDFQAGYKIYQALNKEPENYLKHYFQCG